MTISSVMKMSMEFVISSRFSISFPDKENDIMHPVIIP